MRFRIFVEIHESAQAQETAAETMAARIGRFWNRESCFCRRDVARVSMLREMYVPD